MPEDTKSYKALVTDWLLQQGVSTILLFMILFSGYKVSMYAIETAIPSHLKAIQDGYQNIQDKQTNDIKIIVERFNNAEAKQNNLIEANTEVVKSSHGVLKEIRDQLKKEKQ